MENNTVLELLSELGIDKLIEYSNKINNLNRDRQERLVKSICQNIDNLYYQEQAEVCKKEGHIYGDWSFEPYTPVNAGPQNLWVRRCTRCKSSELTRTNPEIVKIKKKDFNKGSN